MTCPFATQDAEKAIALGIEGIVVSNHGMLHVHLLTLGGLKLDHWKVAAN